MDSFLYGKKWKRTDGVITLRMVNLREMKMKDHAFKPPKKYTVPIKILNSQAFIPTYKNNTPWGSRALFVLHTHNRDPPVLREFNRKDKLQFYFEPISDTAEAKDEPTDA